MIRAVALSLALLAGPATAETALDAQGFEAHTTGRTLTFSANGVEYGAEQYFDNRRVRWSFLDGECKDGTWYPEGDAICFVYEDGTGPQCWRFFSEPGGLRAEFVGETGGVLYQTEASEQPLVCLGPEVGV